MKKTIVAAALGAGALVAFAGAAPATAAPTDTAMLSVLHGVPGLTVDVYVNDELTLDDFEPGDLAGPLELPAGTYTVAITASDATDASSPAIGPVDLPLEGGVNYTAVAHLTEGGDPTATLFTNDTSQLAAGQGRLTVRHVAAAPAVDVLAGGSPVITALANPAEAKLDLPAGTVSAAVAATGTTEPVLGPADVEVAEGANTIVYAWGSLEADNLDLAVQTVAVAGMNSSPDGVPAGSAGLVATNGPDSGAPVWAAVIGTSLLAAVALLAGVGRRRSAARAER
ncbi:MAG: Lipoprotein [Agromyces sp.]|nr:Lipoprotein [Agromyces sp.]